MEGKIAKIKTQFSNGPLDILTFGNRNGNGEHGVIVVCEQMLLGLIVLTNGRAQNIQFGADRNDFNGQYTEMD